MAAWDVSSCRHESKPSLLAEEAQAIEPAHRFCNVLAQHHGTEGEKVRSLAFDPHGCVSIHFHSKFLHLFSTIRTTAVDVGIIADQSIQCNRPLLGHIYFPTGVCRVL